MLQSPTLIGEVEAALYEASDEDMHLNFGISGRKL